jgi:Tfp pilus assembly protein PilF
LQQLLEFLKTDRSDEFTRFAIATEYAREGEMERAREYFEALVRDSPDYIGTYYHLGKLYEALGEQKLAEKTYREGIDVAERLRDGHAKSELQSALMEVELGDDW